MSSNQRTFIIERSDINITGKKFTSSKPIQCARKVATHLFENIESGKKRKLTFSIKEITKSKKHTIFSYTAIKYKTDKKSEYKIKVSVLDTKQRKNNQKKGGSSKNYIVITDIGRDIDDTLALMVLLYKHKINEISLKAIVVAGHNLEEREKLVYYWLWKYDLNNIPVIVSPTMPQVENLNERKNEENCVMPNDFNMFIKSIQNNESDSSDIIKNYIGNYNTKIWGNSDTKQSHHKMLDIIKNNINLYILCIANFSIFSESFFNLLKRSDKAVEGQDKERIDLRTILKNNIKHIYVQGSFTIKETNPLNKTAKMYVKDINSQDKGRYEQIKPNELILDNKVISLPDYNTSLDIQASKKTFEELAPIIPFSFVGKQTAYLIRFYEDEFAEIDKYGGTNLNEQVKNGVINFICTKPVAFINFVFNQDFKNNSPPLYDPKNNLIRFDDDTTFLLSELSNDTKQQESFFMYLTKYSNVYDLLLIYLALNDNIFIKYDETQTEIKEPIMKEEIDPIDNSRKYIHSVDAITAQPLYHYSKYTINGVSHIQYNQRDASKSFANNATGENIRDILKDLVINSTTEIKNNRQNGGKKSVSRKHKN